MSSHENDGERRNSFPSTFPVSMTHTEFPSSFQLLERSGLPYGSIITPFIRREDLPLSQNIVMADSASQISRCETCAAYTNPFSNVSSSRWYCALCGHKNEHIWNLNSRNPKQDRKINSEGLENREEHNCLLSDFPTPFRAEDVAQGIALDPKLEGRFAVPISERPLVHLFVIQESMPIDALQAVIEAISHVTQNCIHPDMKVALLTISNRIGVYRLIDQVPKGSKLPKPDENSYGGGSTKVPPVPHSNASSDGLSAFMHFGQSCGAGLQMHGNTRYAMKTSLSSMLQNAGFCESLAANASAAGYTGSLDEISVLLGPKGSLWKSSGPFLDNCFSIGSPGCKEGLQDALTEVYDAFCTESLATQGIGSKNSYPCDDVQEHEHSGCMPSSEDSPYHGDIGNNSEGFNDAVGETHPVPENALGPALEAITDWICNAEPNKQLDLEDSSIDTGASTNVFNLNEDDMREIRDRESDEEDEEDAGEGGIFGLLADVGIGLLAQTPTNTDWALDNTGSTESKRMNGSKETYTSNEHDRDILPAADQCSGIIMHLFVSSPQDIPSSWHPSGSEPSTGVPSGLSSKWTENLGRTLGNKGVTVNLWAMSSWETAPQDWSGVSGAQVGIHALMPIVEATGGGIERIILGSYPKDERIRFQEVLRRSIAGNEIATRCMMRLRTSPCIKIVEGSMQGHANEDERYPGLYRMSSCTPDTALSFQFEYNVSDRSLNPEEQSDIVALQVAFSYDTLVEGSDELSNCKKEGNFEEEFIDEEANINAYVESCADIWDGLWDSSSSLVQAGLAALRYNKRALCSEIKKNRNSHSGHSKFLRRHDPAYIGPLGIEAPMRDKRNPKKEKCADVHSELCCYDRTKTLLCVRRLRVFTCQIRCTHHPQRLLESLDALSLSLLIARQALSDERQYRKTMQQLRLPPHSPKHGRERDYKFNAEFQNSSQSSGGRYVKEDRTDSSLGGEFEYTIQYSNFKFGSTYEEQQAEDAFRKGVVSPGVEFIDGWAISILAAYAAVGVKHQMKTLNRKGSRQDMHTPEMVRTCVRDAQRNSEAYEALQFLFGIRVHLLASRVHARTIAHSISTGIQNSNIGHRNNQLTACLVTDEFAELSHRLRSFGVTTASKLLLPTLLPLQKMSVTSAVTPNEEIPQWVVRHLHVPLSHEGIVLSRSPILMLDAGSSLVLYRSSGWDANLEYVKPIQGSKCISPASSSSCKNDIVIDKISSDNETTGVLHDVAPEAHMIGAPTAGISSPIHSLDILGHLDRFAGNILGNSSEDEGQYSNHIDIANNINDKCDISISNPEVVKIKEQKKKDIEDLKTGKRMLSQLDQKWVPQVVQRLVDQSPLVPRILDSRQGTSSAAFMAKHLLLDVQDEIGGEAYNMTIDHKNNYSSIILSFETWLSWSYSNAEEECESQLQA